MSYATGTLATANVFSFLTVIPTEVEKLPHSEAFVVISIEVTEKSKSYSVAPKSGVVVLLVLPLTSFGTPA